IASSAAIHSSRDQSRKSPGAGPSALLRRISGPGQAASAAARPAPVVISAANLVSLTPGAAADSAPALSTTSRLRATKVTSTPSRASAKEQACPRPRLARLSSAWRPRSPRSIFSRSLRPSQAAAEIHSCRFGIWRYSRCDGRNRPDLVAVLLVESELLHDANAFGQRLALEGA